MKAAKKCKALIIAAVLVFIIIALPLIMVGLSFIGRVAPDSVIPDSFYTYASSPDPARLAGRILNHEPLPDIMALAELSPNDNSPRDNTQAPHAGVSFASALKRLKDSGLTEKGWFRFAARGGLDAAVLEGGRILAAYTEEGTPLPGFPLTLDGVFYVQPVFDGEALWIIESEGTLYRAGLDGGILCQKIPRVSVKEEGYLFAANSGGDAAKLAGPAGNIFFSGEGNALHGYSGNFSSLDGFPLPIWGRPVFADLNGDGKTEASGVGMDNRLYMWQFR